MKRFIPFRGVRYNSKIVGNVSQVLAPPYDVISEQEQGQLYDASPYNTIRLELNRATGDQKYTEAKETFDNWQRENVLVREEKPVIYFYRQVFVPPGGTVEQSRGGFLGLLKAEPFSEGRVLPHERTLSGPKADRIKLIETTQANFSPIFALYHDPEKQLLDIEESRMTKVVDAESKYGREQLFAIDDPELIEQIGNLIEERKIYIADGHHRYETAVAYRDARLAADPDSERPSPVEYVMVYLSNMNDEGLAVFPVHRLIHSLDKVDAEEIINVLGEYLTVESFENAADNRSEFEDRLNEVGRDESAFGLVSADGSISVICHSPKWEKVDALIGLDSPEPLRRVDVTLLHAVLCEHLLKIDKQRQADGTNIKFCQGLDKAFEMLGSGDFQLAAFVNTPRLDLVRAVAESGSTMPQKSTYFYPKLISGLAFNRVDSW